MNKQYILDRVRVDPDTNCWVWQQWKNYNGYGEGWYEKRKQLVHRISYKLFVGALKDEEIVMHSCDNPPCCNPDHLAKGSMMDNQRDMVDKGRDNPHKRHVTRCPQGHPYDENNTYILPATGERQCKECRRIRRKSYRERTGK